jgi:hypothetical protein
MSSNIADRIAAIEGVSLHDSGGGVSFVLIPADTSLPPVQLFLRTPSTNSLQDFLECYFSIQKDETVDMQLLQQQANDARECLTGMCPHVSPLTLKRAAEAGTIQTVAVTDSIQMYYDESANLKQRPLNVRAQEYTKGTETIYGDVFLVCMQESQPSSLTIHALEMKAWFS